MESLFMGNGKYSKSTKMKIPYSIRWTGKARMQLSILSPHKLYNLTMLSTEQRYLHESHGDK